MNVEDFYTAAKATEGVQVNLPSPGGKPTKEWIRLRHVDSDVFRMEKNRILSERVQLLKIEDEQERRTKLEEMRIRMLVPLVAGWSFDTECTPEAVFELLTNAPYLADWVDLESVKADNFFSNASPTS